MSRGRSPVSPVAAWRPPLVALAAGRSPVLALRVAAGVLRVLASPVAYAGHVPVLRAALGQAALPSFFAFDWARR